jgi:glycosyltransferase involved in cell wall biosynthesis
MPENFTFPDKMADLRCCAVIATYNNDNTLGEVIRDALVYCRDVIVVNDGSTDHTSALLQNWPQVHRIDVPENTGKGWALRQGFRYAIEKGFRYAVTLDSDGQHFPSDIPAFLELVEDNPDSMIIGARNMEQEAVPGTSSFGHKFSIFWFKVETGQTVPDVQTGYRLYPLNYVRDLGRLYTKKYEFEVEVLVRLAWAGVKILSVPVKVYYAPKDIRISHFRKFRDFSRVSVMNSILVFMALLWVRPFLFFKNLRKKSVREVIKKYVLDSTDSNARLALSVGTGLFLGVVPIWGWQLMAAFGVAYLFRLNRFITVAFSNISLPPMLPIILFASYYTGGLILGTNSASAPFTSEIDFEWFKSNLLQYVIGSIVFGLVMGGVSGLITYILLSIFRKTKPGANIEISESTG